MDELIEIIIRHIDDLYNDWRETEALLLTEIDLQSHIYARLINDNHFSQRVATRDQEVFGKKVHSGISWFGDGENENRLCITPDISIIDPRNLSLTTNLYSEGLPLPRKGFSFQGDAILLEIKFQRFEVMNTNFVSGRNGVQKDIGNLNTLINKFRDFGIEENIFGITVIFDKAIVSNKQRIERLLPVNDHLTLLYRNFDPDNN